MASDARAQVDGKGRARRDGTPLTYGSHLRLDQILTAQVPVSDSPDEMLFIIQHQTSELWLKLILTELDRARACLTGRQIRPGLKALGRARAIFGHLVSSWEVLRTLGPTEFAAFRGALGSASGFQSCQYRLVEFVLGNRSAAMLDPHPAEAREVLRAELERPSLYHVALELLAERLDLRFPDAVFARDRHPVADPAVEAAWTAVYLDQDAHSALHDLAESLVDLEDRFRCWRFNHVTTVERVIGMKRGTGGTSGVAFLRKMLDVELFPDLWRVRAAV